MPSTPYGGRNERSYDIMRRFLNEDMVESFLNGNMPMFATGFIRADIKETDNEFIIDADLPGFRKEEIEVQYEKDTLTIIAGQQEIYNNEKDQYIRRERHYGELKRSFLIENILEDQIRAEYREGVLRVVLPKDKNIAAKRRRVKVF
jgi:HSP20 family protein